MVQQTKDKNQPTPGPWRVEGNRYICGPGPGRNWSLRVIATVIGANATTDATLIAAVHDLLAACEAHLKALSASEESLADRLMETAIAKARGTA